MIMATGIMATSMITWLEASPSSPRLRHAATRPWGLTARSNQANWADHAFDAALSTESTNLNPPSRKSLTQII
jgi:hypothetical protein